MSGAAGRTGPNWERIFADYCASEGLPWDRAPLRGTRDLLDLQGTIPAGFPYRHHAPGGTMTPDMTGYSSDDLQALSTTDLLHILLNERLTAREIRIIKAELKTQEI